MARIQKAVSTGRRIEEPSAPTIGDYLIDRLYALGLRHIFGIPGDYVLGFYDSLAHSKLKLINTCDEQGAGFAADAYARVNGLGAVCVTYCVGGLKLANTTAEAYAEKSPVVIISGAPGIREREKDLLLHHKVRDFDTQKRVFEQLTVASTVLGDPQIALQEIDRVLNAALRYKRPVYIELPRDTVTMRGLPDYKPLELRQTTDHIILRESISEAAAMINQARQPVILADVEIHRFGLQKQLVQLINKTNIPVAATIMGKSVVAESGDYYLGVYEGAMGGESVRRYVEESDCVIMLGAFMTDINLGIFTARLDPAKSICATSEKLTIRYHNFEGVQFTDFVNALIKAPLRKRELAKFPQPKTLPPFTPSRGKKMTIKRLFQRLNTFLSDDTIVVADVGDSLFASADLSIHKHTEFLGTAYYASMGFAVPAAIGAQMAAPERRPLVLVGDGAFQMTGMELTTAIRCGLNPIVLVLNNAGYGTERHILDGPFNDLLPWKYHMLPQILGSGTGFLVETEDQLEIALAQAADNRESFSLLDIKLDPLDRSPAMERLAKGLARRL